MTDIRTGGRASLATAAQTVSQAARDTAAALHAPPPRNRLLALLAVRIARFNQAGQPIACWYARKIRCFIDGGGV
jgi:hypothetical protein